MKKQDTFEKKEGNLVVKSSRETEMVYNPVQIDLMIERAEQRVVDALAYRDEAFALRDKAVQLGVINEITPE